MRSLKLTLVAFLGLGLLGMGMTSSARDKDTPKYKIKEVMKEAMKGGLCEKVAKGNADKAEIAQLVEYFTALAADTPPKGDKADWKTRTTALLTAAKEIAAGKESGADKLKKAADCKACHSLHK